MFLHRDRLPGLLLLLHQFLTASALDDKDTFPADTLFLIVADCLRKCGLKSSLEFLRQLPANRQSAVSQCILQFF